MAGSIVLSDLAQSDAAIRSMCPDAVPELIRLRPGIGIKNRGLIPRPRY